MGISPLRFTGISDYSDDFQTIIDRAVSIAAIPLTDLQNEQADLLSKKQLLTGLSGSSATLGSAIAKLGALGESKAVAARSSNNAKVTATTTGLTQAGVYSITEVISLAQPASERTVTGLATSGSTPVSTDGVLELVVGTSTFSIDLTAQDKNNLNGLRDAINALGAGVSASVLNTGTGSSPYYLSITADTTGSQKLELRETAGNASSNILTADNQGSNAKFKFNGLDIERSENTITGLVNDLSLTLLDTTDGEGVTLTVSSDRATLASALEDFVDGYNDLATEVSAQVGQSAGLLSGDFLVRQIQADLRSLSTYRGEGSMNSLASLGIEFDSAGVMSLNADAFDALTDGQIGSAFDFLGSSSSGFGGLSSVFSSLSDPISGLIKTQQNFYDATDRRLGEKVTELSERIAAMQVSLTDRLQQADALLSALTSQQSMLDASIDSLNLMLYGKRES